MPTTSNFGWTTPADTDLVKDGAAAIRTLGNGIDTSLIDLKGGTTGQVLSKNSNTDLDYTWVTPNVGDITEVQAGTGISVASGTGPIPVVTNTVATAFDAKGDLIAGTGADTFSKLTVGANNTVLTADSSTATGLKWAASSSGAMTFITKNTFSNVANVAINDIFSSTYDNYQVYIEIAPATTSDDVILQVNYSGTIETLACYYGVCFKAYTTTGQTATTGASQFTLLDETGWVMLNFQNVGNTGEKPQWHGTGVTNNSVGCLICGYTTETKTITGINLKSSSSNITGFVTVYGLAKS